MENYFSEDQKVSPLSKYRQEQIQKTFTIISKRED